MEQGGHSREMLGGRRGWSVPITKLQREQALRKARVVACVSCGQWSQGADPGQAQKSLHYTKGRYLMTLGAPGKCHGCFISIFFFLLPNNYGHGAPTQ